MKNFFIDSHKRFRFAANDGNYYVLTPITSGGFLVEQIKSGVLITNNNSKAIEKLLEKI